MSNFKAPLMAALGEVLMYFAFIFIPFVNAGLLLVFTAVMLFAGVCMGLEWLGNKLQDITVIKGREE